MKKILLLTISVITLLSCGQSNEEKAKGLIESHLKETMKDWSSYEPVNYSPLDSTFNEYKNTPEGAKIQLEVSKLQLQSDSLRYIHDLKGALKSIEKAIELDSIYKVNAKSYKGYFNGWQMIHKYRGNNSYGAKTIATTAFFFDKDITKIKETLSLDD